MMYPVMLEVRDARCLVVGGGGVALRKVDGLLAEGAAITVVAPKPMPALEKLAEEMAMQLEKRPYEPGEAANYTLVLAATDDRAVNQQVYEDARQAGIWVNVADDPELSSFHLPARVQRGALQLAIGSGGEAPFVTRRLRQMFERRLGPEWTEWLRAAARFRQAVRRAQLDRSGQETRYDAFFNGTIDKDGLTARVPTAAEEAEYLSVQHPSTCIEASRPDTEKKKFGLVSLIGAGPGDAGLLTIRGRQRLLTADAVVYDRLAASALPCDLQSEVELHPVGKQANHHPVQQQEIDELLVRLARKGKRVVRLKGGDPFVFGRGSEEAQALAKAGIPFEIVPGVTAGVAVPAYTGIPVTHRREVVRVTMVTAHEAIKSDGPQQRWDLLAADRHQTIIGYMGVSSLGDVVRNLVAEGMDPKTPAAMVQQGTTSKQRVVVSTLADLPDAVTRAEIRPPGLFVIGPSVHHAEDLDWFGRRPLLGERLVLAAPAGTLGEALELQGAEVVVTPLPVTPAARVVMDAMPITGFVLRTAEEVDALEEERDRSLWDSNVAAWCLGQAAAERARGLGWRKVFELQDSATATDLSVVIDKPAT